MEQAKQTFQATTARLGLNICAANGANGISLREAAKRYLAQKWNISGIDSEIANQEGSNQAFGRHLFYSGAEQIRKPFMVFDLVREIWFMHVLSELDTSCSYAELKRLYEKKMDEERACDPKVSWTRYSSLLNQCLYNDTQIEQIQGLLKCSREDIAAGLTILLEFFAARSLTFIGQVYAAVNQADAHQLLNTAQIPQRSSEPQSPEIQEPKAESSTLETEDETEQELLRQIEEEIENCYSIITKQVEEIDKCHTIIAKQATDIKYLERVKRDYEINLENAQKDEVRRILESLTAKRFGSPLSELYLLMRNSDAPDSVRAVAINLFAALESLDISLFRTDQIGRPVLLTADTQEAYVPADGEHITLEDEVIIRYPGYRYCGKMIVHPVIEKVRK